MHKRGPVHAVLMTGTCIPVRRFGPPKVLRPEPFEPQPPRPGEVQVEVAYAAINFAELLQRMGLYQAAPKKPFIPGFEVSGTIAAVGEGVTDDKAKVGDRVVAVTRFGGYASHVNAGVGQLIPVPDGIPLDQAAAFSVTYLTAWEALRHQAKVEPGESVLVHGGAGGVGSAAITLATHLGCTVYATCGSEAKVRWLEDEAGVDKAFLYTDDDWPERIRDAVGKVDVVLESRGGKNLQRSRSMLRPRGRLVMYGAQDVAPGKRRNPWTALRALWAMQIPILPLVRQGVGVHAFHLLYMWADGVDLRADAEALWRLILDGKVAPPRVDRVFPFDEVADAHQYIHDRRNVGKVLLRP